MDFNRDGIYNLCNAVILQACTDYISGQYSRKALEDFFHSSWYSMLVRESIDPDLLIQHLQRRSRIVEREEFIKSMHSCIMACDDPEVHRIWYCTGWDGEEDSLSWCCEGEQFQHIMNTFMWLIGKSRLHGGMTVDGVHAEENW